MYGVRQFWASTLRPYVIVRKIRTCTAFGRSLHMPPWWQRGKWLHNHTSQWRVQKWLELRFGPQAIQNTQSSNRSVNRLGRRNSNGTSKRACRPLLVPCQKYQRQRNTRISQWNEVPFNSEKTIIKIVHQISPPDEVGSWNFSKFLAPDVVNAPVQVRASPEYITKHTNIVFHISQLVKAYKKL